MVPRISSRRPMPSAKMHGYSSTSEDSDDEYIRRRQKGIATPASSSTDNNKKKKKRKYPPQQSINRVWKKFSKKQFSRAMAILPFEPVPPPPEQSNELLSAGYERAAEECRRKVRKIIQECRRVNMRYRDSGWDLDWDLKYEKGHCLNKLGRTKFDLSSSSSDPNARVPKAVKRVHEIFEKPTFMGSIDASDIKQGAVGDCWLIASMSGLANVPDGMKRICVEYDTRIGIYGFVFYRDGEWIYSIIDDKLYLTSPTWDSPSLQRELLQQIDREDVERVYRKTYQTGSKALFFAGNKDQNETWVPLLEKAYAKAHGDFASIHGGWIGEGLEDLSGGVTTELLASDILDLDGFWDNELSRVNEEFLFGCSTGLLEGGYGNRNGITERHAYIVMEARTLKNGTRLVKLRNPWGKIKKGLWEGAWSDGSKEWTTEAQEELNHQFGNDSVFWISYEDLLTKYLHFDRTRLFRDPSWRCCQRWISVDVPWKAQFHEKFHIKLTKESPLVLVLAQLDDRYFHGLEGQYSFRLHFRLHEQDRADAEDYIVRSHGNYLMERSVSIELPAMLPGRYSVFLRVEAEREPSKPSIEEVVRRECKDKVQNEKLAQVGAAYDLAHSKAVAHFDAVSAARKKKERRRARDSRDGERHRNWEKRHITRDVNKKQGRKNNEKIKAKLAVKEAKLAEETKKKEEEEKAKKEAEEKVKKEEEEKKAAEEKAKNDEEDKKRQEEEKKKEAEAKTADSLSASNDKTVEGNESSDETPMPTPATTPAVEKPEPEAQVEADAEPQSEKKAEKPAEHDSTAATKTEDGDTASTSTSSTNSPAILTPSSTNSVPVCSPEGANKDKVPVPPVDASNVSGAPPPAPTPAKTDPATPPPAADDEKSGSSSSGSSSSDNATSKVKKPKYYLTSEGESSASPVSDWDELYSSDDMSRHLRLNNPATSAAAAAVKFAYEDSDEGDDAAAPWNAVCVVGLRVYSQDEGLEVRIVMEGGELEEGGMGEKGGPDLDNAQANAGGARVKEKEVKAGEGEGEGEGKCAYEGDSEVDGKKSAKGRKKMGSRRGSRSGKEEEEEGGDGQKMAPPKKEESDLAPYTVIVQKVIVDGESEYEDAAGFMTAEER